MKSNTDLKSYYAQRASEYEKIFAKPERQSDLATLRALLREKLLEHDLFEVACGTGYWTRVISESANSIVATDINEEVLEIARQKKYPRSNVTFRNMDAFALANIHGRFTAGFAGFWWSHVPRQRLAEFLRVFHRNLQPGALVVFLDNNYVEGGSTPISRGDDDGNTYQRRKLDTGAEFEVLKNFPTALELRNSVGNFAESVTVTELKYYWCMSYIPR